MDDRYLTDQERAQLNSQNFTTDTKVENPKRTMYGMSMTAYKSMRRTKGRLSSTLCTKKWTLGRLNQYNADKFKNR